jgi:hypothetical protein
LGLFDNYSTLCAAKEMDLLLFYPSPMTLIEVTRKPYIHVRNPFSDYTCSEQIVIILVLLLD